MIAELFDSEVTEIKRYVEKEVRKEHPKFVLDEVVVEYDGSDIYISYTFQEHKGEHDGDRDHEEYNADDVGCTQGLIDGGREVVEFVKEELVTLILNRIEELNKE